MQIENIVCFVLNKLTNQYIVNYKLYYILY